MARSMSACVVRSYSSRPVKCAHAGVGLSSAYRQYKALHAERASALELTVGWKLPRVEWLHYDATEGLFPVPIFLLFFSRSS